MLIALACTFTAACSCDGAGPAKAGNGRTDTPPNAVTRPVSPDGEPQRLRAVLLRAGGAVLHTEVACTPEQRHRGLMFRRDLGPEEGMLFLFPHPKLQSFWMRNTPLPLSLAYLEADGTIQQIEPLEPFDERSVLSTQATALALEVHRGWFARHGLSAGSRIEGIEEVLADRSFWPR